MHNNCTPPIKSIIQTREGQPATGSPNNNVRIIIIKIIINEQIKRPVPMKAAMAKGAVEKAVIPSKL